jgi:peptide/nickel transport system substrate-binding protein
MVKINEVNVMTNGNDGKEKGTIYALNRLEKLFTQNRISRRDFMAKASALGAAALISPALLGSSAHAAMPKKGGKVTIALSGGSVSDTLDPALAYDLYSMVTFMGTLHSYLTVIDNEGKLVGEVAESFEASPDARIWTFRLRKGIEFHNGKTLDANDVISSINHHRGEDSKSSQKALVEPVVDITAPDKYTVVFELKSGNADFPYLLSERTFAIMQDKDGKPDWQSGIGTGGYMLQSFEPGVKLHVKRNPNYWKPDSAYFDEAEVLSITDVNARTNALISGKVDIMDHPDLKTAHLLGKRSGIRVEEVVGTQHYTLPMLTNVAPFDNNDIRTALKYAMDREAIVKGVLRGHGMVGNDHPIAPSNQYYAKDLPQRQYDPDKAKFHLKKAGLSSLKVDLHTSDAAFQGAEDTALLYQEHAKAAGIDINVVREPKDGYWSNVWIKKPWCMCYWSGRPTEDWALTMTYAAEATWNDTKWKHDRFNKLLVEARTELKSNKRREMYGEMQKIIRDEGGVVIPMFANHLWAVSDKIKHSEKVAANQTLDGARCLERWWFDS